MLHGFVYLEDRLEDIPFSSLSSSLYCGRCQRVAPILGDMADFFVYRVIMHVTASLLSVRSMKFSPMNANAVFLLVLLRPWYSHICRFYVLDDILGV